MGLIEAGNCGGSDGKVDFLLFSDIAAYCGWINKGVERSCRFIVIIQIERIWNESERNLNLG